MEEIWKDIPGYEGLYQVSNLGRVFKFKQKFCTKDMILNPSFTSKGYLRVGLTKNGKRIKIFIHRLVMLTFIGKSNLEVNHINGIKTDNRLENLEYCTCKENINHGWKIGLYQPQQGTMKYNAKLTEEDILEILNLLKTTNLTHKEIAKKYKINKSLISNIRRGVVWRHVKRE